jgi:hypothetical protein
VKRGRKQREFMSSPMEAVNNSLILLGGISPHNSALCRRVFRPSSFWQVLLSLMGSPWMCFC